MADDGRDRRKRKKPGVPEWKETCIGVWSRSAKGENVDDNISGRICNGISIVRINKHVDPKKSMIMEKIKTRGIQIVIQEKDERELRPPSKPHDHTYIAVERVDPEETDAKKQTDSDNEPKDPLDDEVPLMRRVVDVMMMKKTNLEKNVEHYRNEGVTAEDVWNGVCNTCSKHYKTSLRLVSYCHPVEKLGQIYDFAADHIRNASKRWIGGSDNDKKK